MAIESLHVLFHGSEAGVDKGFFTFRVDEGKKITSAFISFLIKSDEGNILIDTGPNPEDAKWMAQTTSTTFVQESPLPDLLQKAGVTANEINMIIMTHLHWDHSGLLSHFPNAEVIVQKEEYKFAMDPLPYAKFFYMTERYNSPKINWKFIEGDFKVVPGLTTIFTPGHTVGTQSVMVDLPESGTILLAGDAGFLKENFDREIIPIYFGSPRQALLSIKRLKVWSQVREALIIPTHDIDFWRDHVKKQPDFYT